MQGDTCKLNFKDEQFDAVTSNYCHHNIICPDRQELILETLRVLKKGGVFAIHDEFTRQRYGDMNSFIKKLRDMGYEKAELINTADGLFITKKEARPLTLGGFALLCGRK